MTQEMALTNLWCVFTSCLVLFMFSPLSVAENSRASPHFSDCLVVTARSTDNKHTSFISSYHQNHGETSENVIAFKAIVILAPNVHSNNSNVAMYMGWGTMLVTRM